MNIGNTAVRIIVSVVAIPVIIAACLSGRLFLLGFVLAIALASFYELGLMARNKSVSVNFPVGLASVALIVLNTYFEIMEFRDLCYAIVALLFIAELFRNKGSALLNTGVTLAGIFYIGLFSSAIVGIREFYSYDYINGGYLIIGLFITIWVCDSAAFFIGSAIGKHKLFPRVSPKKSWEGAVAGFIFAVAAMIILKYIMLGFLSTSAAVATGVIVGTVGQLGDLTESLLKRDAGVKDSSALIPGHGGVFDRFDSLLLTAPVVYLLLTYQL